MPPSSSTAGGSSQPAPWAGWPPYSRSRPVPYPGVPSALSAGIGRTGCFIATSICCQQLRQEGVVDILKTTCQLRQDRSARAHGAHGAPESGGGRAEGPGTCCRWTAWQIGRGEDGWGELDPDSWGPDGEGGAARLVSRGEGGG